MKSYASLSDEQVVDVVRTRDKEAYAQIIKRYQEKLLRYATYLVGDTQSGADVVQESFIKAYIHLRGFDTKKKFSSWIYRIVHNEAIRVVQKFKKHQKLGEWEHVEGDGNVEDAFIKKELVEHAHQCLSEMPLLYKEPLTLLYLEDKSYEEISDILRIPMGTVGVRISRAKGLMKHLCQKHM